MRSLKLGDVKKTTRTTRNELQVTELINGISRTKLLDDPGTWSKGTESNAQNCTQFTAGIAFIGCFLCAEHPTKHCTSFNSFLTCEVSGLIVHIL